MRWPKFLSKSNFADIKFDGSPNVSFEESIEISSNVSDTTYLHPISTSDKVLNITCPTHFEPKYLNNCDKIPKSSLSDVIYVPSSLQVGYSPISASDYIKQILQEKENAIKKLIEEKKFLQKELQNNLLKCKETERVNQELKLQITSNRNNNEVLFKHKSCGDSEPNSSFAKPMIVASTPCRNVAYLDDIKSKSLMNINITPIDKNAKNKSEEKITQNLAKLEIILKKYELNISASLRILQNLLEHKNPNSEDLFNSFFDLELSFNSCDDDIIDDGNVKKEFSDIPSKPIELLTTNERQKFIKKKLEIMCIKAKDILRQWDMFHQQLLICIGSDLLKNPTELYGSLQNHLLVNENHLI